MTGLQAKPCRSRFEDMDVLAVSRLPALVSTNPADVRLVWVMDEDGRDLAGDFDSFFGGVFPKAVAVAQRITGDRGSAEDAAVEALYRPEQNPRVALPCERTHMAPAKP